MIKDKSQGRFSIINNQSSIDNARIIDPKAVLKARAEALALEPEKEEPGEQIEVVEFLLSRIIPRSHALRISCWGSSISVEKFCPSLT
jgi:hypothetical protein